MDEDTIINSPEGTPPTPTVANTNINIATKPNPQSQDLDADMSGVERVFDITPDLNISPVNETDEQKLADKIAILEQQLPKTPLQEALGSINKIPLQDLSAQLKKAQAPIKTEGQAPSITQMPAGNQFQGALGSQPKTSPSPAVTQTKTPGQFVADSQKKPVMIGYNGATVITSLTDAEKFSKKALRTYEGDVAEFMSHNKTSAASIAIAETAKQEKDNSVGKEKVINPEEKKRENKKIILAVSSIVLVLIGVVGAYYLYSQSVFAPRTPTPVVNLATVSLIPSASQVTIAIDDLSPSQIITHITTEVAMKQSPNTIKEIILTKKNNETIVRIGIADLLTLMHISPPNILVRSLTTPWMLGEYSDANGNKDVFVVVTHNFFQNAFAGMLSWENVMADDLKQFLGNTRPAATPRPIVTISTTSTTTATSSVSVSSSTPAVTVATPAQGEIWQQQYFTILGHFTDGIVKNKDAREFRSDAGGVLFLYSFIDNTKLVLTSKESTLAEIITKLEQQSFIR